MSNARPYTALSVGLLAVSSSATLVRLAQAEGLPSTLLAAGRLAVAAAVLTPVVLARHRGDFLRLQPRDVALILVCGAILAIHFATWILSLEYTSVVASVALYSTAPVFVTLLSRPLLQERVSGSVIVGTAVTVLGGVVVALGDSGDASAERAPWLGNSLALVSAITFALYLIIGRRLRAQVPVVPYLWLVYGSAALVAFLPAYVAGQALAGHSARGYTYLLLLGLVPQLVGHSSFNYAVRHLAATVVGLATRLEVVGATIVGIVVLAEWPTLLELVGALLIVAGVSVGIDRRRGSR